MNLSGIYAKPARYLLVALASTAAIAMSGNAFSAQTSTTMAVSMNISSGCSVTSSAMTFPGPTTPVDATATAQIDIICTDGTPFEIGLDAGAHSTDVAAREMQNSGTLVSIIYSIYMTGAHTTVWGNTQGVDTVAGTGNGFDQQFAAYGLAPLPSPVPAAGLYTDTVNVFVYF
ncbi:MAG: spore coat U domain-containing protein [Gammaproteobacteria bacterium]